VLSCDDVPNNPLPATGRQAGIDVGIVRFATTSDGEQVDNPRWGRVAAERLAAAQQRLASAKRGSENRERCRETVAARHRKIANQRKDFHHKQARALVERYDLVVVEDLPIANMTRRAKPVADEENPGQFLPNGARAKSGLNRSIGDAGWGGFVSILRAKAEDAGRIWIEVDPRHTSDGCENAGMQPPKTASPSRRSNASDAVIAHRQTNMPHGTSYGPGWPFTPKRREKKPTAPSRRRSHTRRMACVRAAAAGGTTAHSTPMRSPTRACW
jgi:transposase